MMFNPNTGKCDYLEPSLCRPGQVIHFPNVLKEVDNVLRNEKLISDNKATKVC